MIVAFWGEGEDASNRNGDADGCLLRGMVVEARVTGIELSLCERVGVPSKAGEKQRGRARPRGKRGGG